MTSNPLVSVLMPVYNCELYIAEAIDSILGQTYTNFEFLIIDDASTDTTVSIIKKYTDPRINLIVKPENTGYTNSLNQGLTIAKGKYIARMDGDDRSLPERFAKQVAFMEANPDVVALGTTYSIINSGKIIEVPISHEAIKIELLKKTCFGHPTVMLRNDIFIKNEIKYNINTEPAEDYNLWVRLLQYGKLHNLPEVLLHYRVHENQVSQKRKILQHKSSYDTRYYILNYLDLDLEIKEQELLKKIISKDSNLTYKDFLLYEIVNRKICNANKVGYFDEVGLKNYFYILEKQMYKDYFLKRKQFSPKIFIHYLTIKKKWKFNLGIKNEMKLLMKSILSFSKKATY